MANAIILHGKPQKSTYFSHDLPSASNDIWIPWLQNELTIMGISAQTPDMLNAWQPDYRIWKKEFERYDITPETLLVGHSAGGGFIVQWLSEHPDVCVGHVFLVAPSLGDRFTPNDKFDYPVLGGMFEFDIDPALMGRVKSLTVFHSDNDGNRVKASVRYIRDALPNIEYKEFHNYGHFRGKRDMQSDAFPELLAAITLKIGPVVVR
ncbi:MAG TPA: alpha/beta hydrolase [Candidatus Saccharimonadales bacterium]